MENNRKIAEGLSYPLSQMLWQRQLCAARSPGTQRLTRSGGRGAAESEPLLRESETQLREYLTNLNRSSGCKLLGSAIVFSLVRDFAHKTPRCSVANPARGSFAKVKALTEVVRALKSRIGLRAIDRSRDRGWHFERG